MFCIFLWIFKIHSEWLCSLLRQTLNIYCAYVCLVLPDIFVPYTYYFYLCYSVFALLFNLCLISNNSTNLHYVCHMFFITKAVKTHMKPYIYRYMYHTMFCLMIMVTYWCRCYALKRTEKYTHCVGFLY